MKYASTLLALLLTVAIFLPRLADLGTILTTDEPLWLSRSQSFLKALATFNLAGTATSIQPGVVTTWIGALAFPFGTVAAAQAAMGMASGVLILLITYFLVRLWGWRWGMMGGAMLALDPFLIAHSRLVHTDALLALFLLLSAVSMLAAFACGTPRPLSRYLLVSGAAFALATLTKIFALAALPAAAMYIAYAAWKNDKNFSAIVRYGSLWLAALVISMFVAWPALWVQPEQTVRYVISGINQYSSGTRIGEATSEWWYYLREGFFRLTPPITILAGIGLMTLRYAKRNTFLTSVLILLASSITYAIILSLRGERSDRYILFTLLTVDLLAVFGLSVVWSVVRRARSAVRALAPLLIVLPLLLLAAADVRLHPYYLAHYNRLYLVEADHKLGWGEGLEQAAQYIQEHHSGSSVASYYSTVFSHFYTSGATVGLTGDTGADYLVLYRSMFERGPDHPDTDLVHQYLTSGRYQPEHVITINNLPYVWIFRNR